MPENNLRLAAGSVDEVIGPVTGTPGYGADCRRACWQRPRYWMRHSGRHAGLSSAEGVVE